MEAVVGVRLNLTCFGDLSGKSSYLLYQNMRGWLKDRQITHRFDWDDTGKFIPDYLTLDPESAIVFRLVYNI